MTDTNTIVEIDAAGTVLDNMDDLLGDLELNVEAEGADDDLIEALGDDDEAAIDVLVETEAAYDNQPTNESADLTAAAEPAEEKPARKKRAAGVAKTPKTAKPKAERDPSALPAEIFVLSADAPPADLEANKVTVLGARPTQKKIGEKFDNLFTALAAGRAPSVYTMTIYALLKTNDVMTSSELVAAMKASASRSGSSYDEGTARSQVGQMMALFDAVGIATRAGQTLTFNANSKIAERIDALA